MTLSKFKLLIIVSLFMEIMAEVIYEITSYKLSAELHNFITISEQSQENSIFFRIIIITSIPIIVYLIFVLNTMFKLKRNARIHAIIFTCIGILYNLFFEPQIKTGIVTIFSDIGSILWGIVLASMFFSDLKSHFD